MKDKKESDILKVFKKKNTVNFIIATQDMSLLEKAIEEATKQIQKEKIQNANIIISKDIASVSSTK